MLSFYFYSCTLDHRTLINWSCCFYEKCERCVGTNQFAGMSIAITRSVGKFFSPTDRSTASRVYFQFSRGRVMSRAKYIAIYSQNSCNDILRDPIYYRVLKHSLIKLDLVTVNRIRCTACFAAYSILYISMYTMYYFQRFSFRYENK